MLVTVSYCFFVKVFLKLKIAGITKPQIKALREIFGPIQAMVDPFRDRWSSNFHKSFLDCRSDRV